MIGRRGLVPLAAAVIAISASAAAANAATTPAVAGPANHAHAADGRLLPSVALPVNFAPEGIAKGEGPTFYAASLATGDVYQGNLQISATACQASDAVLSASLHQVTVVTGGHGDDGRHRVRPAGPGKMPANRPGLR
jgi:hypothetical protein